MQAASGNVSVGDVLTKSSDGTTWVVATSANFTSALDQVWAVALGAGTSNQPVAIQYVGEVSASVSGLLAGASGYVQVSALGRIERAGLSSKTIGRCNSFGDVVLIPGLGAQGSSNIVSILDYGAVGNGSADDSAAITAATAAMTSGVLYFPPGTYKLSNNCTTPSGVELWFAPGAKLSPDSGKVCTLANTMIRANPTQQIFTTGAGTFAFSVTSGSPPVPEVYAAWFGAKGDCNGTSGNGTDCTAAIQAAIDMAATYNYTARGYKSGTVIYPKGILRITDSGILDADRSGANAFGMRITGAGTCPATITDTTIMWDGATTTYTDVNITATTSTTLTLTSASASFASNIEGSLIYLKGCASAGNNGAFPVKTRVSGTSIVLDTTYLDSITTVAPDANNGSITIALPTKPALKVWSNNNIIENFAITVAPGRYLLCPIDHTEGSAGAVNTYNQFRNIRCDTDNRANAIMLAGLKHADNTTNPGQSPWPYDCENSIFTNCSFARAQYANVYCPSQGGQAKKLVFENCNFGNSSNYGTQNSRFGFFWYSGGFVLRGPAFGYCDTAVLGLSCEQFQIDYANEESCKRGVRAGNNTTGGQPVIINGGRWSLNSLHSDGKFVKFYGAGALTLINVTFDATYSAGFLIDCNNVENGTQRSSNVTAVGCIFPNNAPFATAPAGSGYLRTLLGCAAVRTGASGTFEPIPNEFQKPFVNAITYAEKTYIDSSGIVVNGALATRRGDVTLANGANSDIALGGKSVIRVTGPTGAFSITGFAGGVDGQHLTVYNTVSQTMTVTNDATSTAANRILTMTGANVVLRAAAPSVANFVYDGSGSRWILVSTN